MDVSKVCDALGNGIRFSIIKSLKTKSIGTCCSRIEYYENGLSVGDVVKATGLAQSTVSQHLSVLENAGLIYSEKRGQWTCYFLNIMTIEQFAQAIKEELI